MRCIWSTKTELLLKHCTIRNSPLACFTFGRLSAKRAIHFPVPSRSYSAAHAILDQTRSNRPAGPFWRPSPEDVPQIPTQTKAKARGSVAALLSRSSAQSVRAAVSAGNINTAYFVLDSLLYSNHCRNIPRPKIRVPSILTQPLDFGQPVPYRLSAHALLHAFLRTNQPLLAAEQAYLILKAGYRIRNATLVACMRSLPLAAVPGPGTPSAQILSIQNNQNVLKLLPNIPEDPYVRTGIMLLLEAGRQGHQRKRMFKHARELCLMKGNLLLATMLIAVAVADKQLQQKLAPPLDQSLEATTETYPRSASSNSRIRPKTWPIDDFYARSMMAPILKPISVELGDMPEDGGIPPAVETSLQSLAILADLLDRRELPTGHLSQLIAALASVPQLPKAKVWVWRNGRAVRIKALPYFHDVLVRLVSDLPSKPPAKTAKRRTPPLDLSSYNALLNFALRQRLSPALADRILQHMKSERQPPLEPDIVTINILTRGGTLMRRNDIASAALNAVGLKSKNRKDIGDDPLQPSPTEGRSSPPHMRVSPTGHSSQLDHTLQSLSTEDIDLSSILRPGALLKADIYTLTSYVTHLTATGRPHIVADVLFDILPELRIVDHPTSGPDSQSRRDDLRTSRHQSVERAIQLGPWFFTAVLNALSKDGRTGLAERVWLLAKEAERVNWSRASARLSDPASYSGEPSTHQAWCLPTHAYTIMLQVYGREVRRGLDRSYGGPNGRAAFMHDINRERHSDVWVPRDHGTVRGWAAFIKHVGLRPEDQRWALGHRMSSLLVRDMRSGARRVLHALRAFVPANNGQSESVDLGLKMPRPDARFFNAALQVFRRAPGLRDIYRQNGRSYWRKRLSTVREAYARRGELSHRWTGPLQDIAEMMVSVGYPVPPSLREVFVGRWEPGTWARLDRPPRADLRSPDAFPYSKMRQSRFMAHSLSTRRNRGLPLRRKVRPRGKHERTAENAIFGSSDT